MFDNSSDSGVSPVIGVILMVALTVVLSAVVGNYVFGFTEILGDGSNPSAAVEVDQEQLGSGDWKITVTLVKLQSAEKVRLRRSGTGAIPEITDEGVTDSITVSSGETISVVAVNGQSEQVTQTITAGGG